MAVQPVPSPTTFSPQRVQMPGGVGAGRRWKVEADNDTLTLPNTTILQ